jgi:hypothetical protein
MKKLSILLVMVFVLTFLFSFDVGRVFAQSTTWTASNVTFAVRTTKIVTNTSNVQSFQVKVHPFTGTITLFTDNTSGDPTTGTVTPPAGLITPPAITSCYLGFVGTLEKKNPTPVYVCIEDLVNVSVDKPSGKGENAYIVGTGEFFTATDSGLIFLKAAWHENDVSGLPASISLVSGKLQGGSGGPAESTSSRLVSASFAATFSK